MLSNGQISGHSIADEVNDLVGAVFCSRTDPDVVRKIRMIHIHSVINDGDDYRARRDDFFPGIVNGKLLDIVLQTRMRVVRRGIPF